MPQMYPLYWLILMMYFMFVMMMLIMLIYFFYLNLPSKKIISMNDINLMNWMW